MKLFVYEYITGGGTWHTAGTIDPTGTLLAEGAAMAMAVIADLVAAGHTAIALLDSRLKGRIEPPCPILPVASASEETSLFARHVHQADATLVVAPEIGGALLERCRRVEELGGRLVSPDAAFIAIAANKQATAERLRGNKVPMPPGMRLGSAREAISPSLFPAVLKPCDGAGSWQICSVADDTGLRRRLELPTLRQELARGNLRLEHFVPGMATSVAVLSGPNQRIVLDPCEQILRGSFEYCGGRLPLDLPLATRAKELAIQAVRAMPETIGYIGVDLILGAASDGRDDYVIEINPRLTTSYVGLRAACRQNLASVMLEVAMGRPAAVSFHDQPLEFSSDGKLRSVFSMKP